MSHYAGGRLAGLLMLALIGSQRGAPTTAPPTADGQPSAQADSFLGSRGGDGREAHGVQPLWPCREAGGNWELDGVKLKICI